LHRGGGSGSGIRRPLASTTAVIERTDRRLDMTTDGRNSGIVLQPSARGARARKRISPATRIGSGPEQPQRGDHGRGSGASGAGCCSEKGFSTTGGGGWRPGLFRYLCGFLGHCFQRRGSWILDWLSLGGDGDVGAICAPYKTLGGQHGLVTDFETEFARLDCRHALLADYWAALPGCFGFQRSGLLSLAGPGCRAGKACARSRIIVSNLADQQNPARRW